MVRFLNIVTAILVIASCGYQKNSNAAEPTMNCPAMNFGPNEPEFNEKYGLDINLPIEESDFLNIINEIQVTYHVRGMDEVLNLPKQMKWCKNYNMENISYGYWIYGPVQEERGYRQIYVALVNSSGYIEYIEPQYAYR